MGALEKNVLGDPEGGDTSDEVQKGRLEDVRDTLRGILDQAGGKPKQEGALARLCPSGPPLANHPREPYRRRTQRIGTS